MAQIGLGTNPASQSNTPPLSRYRIRVVAYNVVVRPTLSLLSWLWRGFVTLIVTVIVGSLVGNAALSLITTGTLGLSDPRGWAIAQPMLDHPDEAYLGIAVAALIALVAYAGYRSQDRIIPPDLQRFHAARVSRAAAQDFIRHFNPFYVGRRLAQPRLSAGSLEASASTADSLARKELDAAKKRKLAQSNGDHVGICASGQPMLGTTRLAWEAMKAEVRSWTFVSWPENVSFDKWDRLLRILQRRRAKLVLWLDNLSKYTNSPGMVAYINSLPDWLEAQRVRFVIVATCHEEEENGPVHQQFAPLFRRLVSIVPARITREEASQLASAMSHSGQLEPFNERAFDGLPGSVVFGISRMREEVYPNLGQPAQLVLKTIKLLRSAGITEYTLQRVIVVARDVFHLQPDQVTDAIEVVRRSGFVLPGSPTTDGQPTIVPATDFLLDVAVPDYVQGSDAIPDWPLLQVSLERIRDGRALARLGDAFREQVDFSHAEQCFEHALPAFRRADAPLEWADLQYGLGLVLSQHASEAQDEERIHLLDRAQDCFTNVLSVVNQQNHPAMWVGAMEAWREVLRRERTTTGTPSRIQSIEKALAAARRDAAVAPSDNPAAKAEALLNVGVLQFLQARFEQNAGTRWHMLDRTIKTLEEVLSILTSDSDPAVWARANSSLGDVCRIRAEVAGSQLKAGFLTKAVDAYEAALARPVPQRTVHEEAELRFQLGSTLEMLAHLKEGAEGAAVLERAVDALRVAARQFERKRYVIEQAETRALLGRVLGKMAGGSDGEERVNLLTQAIIECEYAVGVLDPDERDRGDEIRVQVAELLWRRAKAKSPDLGESTMDAARVVAMCDVVIGHEGTRERAPSLYQQATALRREAQTSSRASAQIPPASL